MSRGARPDVTKWDDKHTTYKCADGVDVRVPSTSFIQEQSYSDYTDDQTVPLNGIRYEVRKKKNIISLLVSETKFDRNMLRILKGAEDAMTITFPKTVRAVQDDAFQRKAVRSAVLNEGLKVLGKCD